jgi:signal peptidase I
MKKFWKVVNWIFDWIMNIIFATILIGGGAWCIKDIFFN